MSVARLAERIEQEKDSDREEHWVRGYSHIFETNPTIRLVQDSGANAHTINDATGSPRFIDVKAFFIEVEDFASSLKLNTDDRYAKVIRQIEAGTQKAVEHEFYHGFAARASGNNNQYLTKSGPDLTIVRGGAVALMQEGLGFLEYAIAQSPIGEQGIIHMTRDMAALLGSQWILERPDAQGIPHLETTNGTPVCVGSGYDGSGPKAAIATIAISSGAVATITTDSPHALSVNDLVTIEYNDPDLSRLNGTFTVTGTPSTTVFTVSVSAGPAVAESLGDGIAYFAPDQDHKWMWATGIVDVNLGKIEVTTPEGTGAGYDVAGNKNEIRLKAIRPAAVHHEPTVHAGVKVQVHE